MNAIARIKVPARSGRTTRLQPAKWAADLVRRFQHEFDAAQDRSDYVIRVKVDEFPSGAEILKRDRKEWLELAVAVMALLDALRSRAQKRRFDEHDFNMKNLRALDAIKLLADRLLQPRLAFDSAQLAEIIDIAGENVDLQSQQGRGLCWSPVLPRALFVKQAEYLVGGGQVTRPLADALGRFRKALGSRDPQAQQRLERLLDARGEVETTLRASTWRDTIVKSLASVPKAAAALAREAIGLAIAASGKTKPNDKWLAAAQALARKDGRLLARVLDWIRAHEPVAGKADPNEDTIRGLIWFTAAFADDGVVSALGRYCELCFAKVPGIGARSVKLGNAAILALETIGSVPAVAELSRLKTRIRYPTAVQRLCQALDAVAARAGVTADELEETALPRFELSPDGERRVALEGGAALLRLAGTAEVTIEWEAEDGRRAAAPPKALKAADPEGVRAVRALATEIAGLSSAQAVRLEGSYLGERSWPFAVWHARWLGHPLRRALSSRLIWRFEQRGECRTGLPRGPAIEDPTGNPLAVDADATVSLWHPLHDGAGAVLAWRERLASLGITQPFKQAHREVYVVTDAERQTGTYSNRFAAHILRQHQFKALANQRGWRFQLMGPWDSHSTPVRALPRHGLTAEYWVDVIEDSDATDAGIYTVITTDKVRFAQAGGEPVTMADLPLLVFSEVMRDVDLFVGVASVGNDPTWADGGPQGRYRDYWTGYAVGELSATARTRAEVLQRLLPRLAIADRCRIDGRFLVVEGRLGTYKIHLGSANVLIMPGNSYLCIVPGRATREPGSAGVMLPFEGDATLSIILSKAFLLAADDRIEDRTILRQITGRHPQAGTSPLER